MFDDRINCMEPKLTGIGLVTLLEIQIKSVPILF